MSSQRVRLLSSSDTTQILDAKIVSIRWDLLPWSLVLDCDIPSDEGVNCLSKYRGWIVFDGTRDITLDLESIRLPNGIFCNGGIEVVNSTTPLFEYKLPALLPRFSGDIISNNPHAILSVTAKGLRGVISTNAGAFGDLGPDRAQRNALATDEELLQALVGT
jgi:hypothetical protein